MSQSRKPKISLILLAAGRSSRMNGAPKQLLVYEGKTLLRRAVETALDSNFETIVVLSADGEIFSKEIEGLPVQTAINENAETGISSSIKTGLSALSGKSSDSVIITLCDQPLVSTEILQNLGGVFVQTGKPIVACEYEKTFGVPALFARRFFSELMNLREDEGAKKIIKKYREQAEFIRCPEAETDIDTFDDYRKLVSQIPSIL